MIAMIRVGEEELEPNTELLELQASHIWFNKAGNGHQLLAIHCKKRFPDFPSPGISVNYSRPGRVWKVTSRLKTGKSVIFFYSVSVHHQWMLSNNRWYFLFLTRKSF